MAAISADGVIDFIALHTPNGARILINPKEITSLREPQSEALRHFVHGTRCVLVLNNSQFNAVRESCDEVAAMVGWRPHP